MIQRLSQNDLAIIKVKIHDMAADQLPVNFEWGSQQTARHLTKIRAYLADAGQISKPIARNKFFHERICRPVQSI